MRVPFEEVVAIVRPWAELHGFAFSAVLVGGDEHARVEMDDGRFRRLLDVFALDAFGNVAVDLMSDSQGACRAYTGPAPDLPRMLEEARLAGERALDLN